MSSGSASGLVLGLDGARLGTRSGWAVAVVALDARGEPARLRELRFVERAAELLHVEGVRAIGVDMPLGLVERGWRSADLAGRLALGGRRSTLFPIAPRPVLYAADYAEARRLTLALTGKGLSKQAYHLGRTIAELDELLVTPAARAGAPWFEVHPELSFRAMEGLTRAGAADEGRALPERKHSWVGLQRRLGLLAAHGLEPLAEHALRPDSGRAGEVPADDLVDAVAVAWSTARALAGAAQTFEGAPPQDDPTTGRRITIHA